MLEEPWSTPGASASEPRQQGNDFRGCLRASFVAPIGSSAVARMQPQRGQDHSLSGDDRNRWTLAVPEVFSNVVVAIGLLGAQSADSTFDLSY